MTPLHRFAWTLLSFVIMAAGIFVWGGIAVWRERRRR
jgi:hypothetical protein